MLETTTIEPFRILAFAALTLSVRVLTWTSLLVGSAIFTFAVIEPSRERTIAAAAYALLIFLPSIFVEKRRQPQAPPTRRPTVAEDLEHYANG